MQNQHFRVLPRNVTVSIQKESFNFYIGMTSSLNWQDMADGLLLFPYSNGLSNLKACFLALRLCFFHHRLLLNWFSTFSDLQLTWITDCRVALPPQMWPGITETMGHKAFTFTAAIFPWIGQLFLKNMLSEYIHIMSKNWIQGTLACFYNISVFLRGFDFLGCNVAE